MHLQNSAASSRATSVGFSRLSMLKCCLIFPCPADEGEIFRVGKHIHSILKVRGGLYYQVLDIPPSACAVSLRGSHDELMYEAGKINEAQFRQFARYRIMEKEVGLYFYYYSMAFTVEWLTYLLCHSISLQRLPKLVQPLSCHTKNHNRKSIALRCLMHPNGVLALMIEGKSPQTFEIKATRQCLCSFPVL